MDLKFSNISSRGISFVRKQKERYHTVHRVESKTKFNHQQYVVFDIFQLDNTRPQVGSACTRGWTYSKDNHIERTNPYAAISQGYIS